MQIRLRSPRILAAGILLAGVSFSWAQDQSHVIVVKAEKFAFAPPLSQVKPLPPRPAAEDEDRAPLHRRVASTTTEDAALQSSRDFVPLAALSPLSTSPGVNILGVGAGFPGYPAIPQSSVPDTNGAVGPTQFVQFVNDSFAIFNKSGGLVSGPTGGDTLWQPLAPSPCYGTLHLDEIAQFDKFNQRWVMMMPSATSLCIAVSKTSDAFTGGWNLYSFPIPSSSTLCGGPCAADYPKLAVWPDAYYVSYNESNKGTFEGDAVCALDSASMVAGSTTPAKMQCFVDQNPIYGDMLPADLDGTTPPPTGSPAYFLNFDSNGSSLDLWQFHVDWTTPSNSTYGSQTNPGTPNSVISVAAFTQPCGETQLQITYSTGHCIPQFNTTNTLDSYGDRLMYRVTYRNFPGSSSISAHESILANQTVQPNGLGNPTAIQWYELQSTGTGFSLYQQGTYSPDSSYRWAGSIAMDQAGDIALGYSVSDSTISPTIRYTGRLGTDPINTMESEIDILSAAGISPTSLKNTFHWADYASMAIDPTDDCTFWFTTEYVPPSGGNWSTRIASFKFPSCGVAPPPPDFTVTSTPASQTVSAGSPATFSVAVAAQNGFNSPVNLTCVVPQGVEMTCVLPTTATPGQSVTLTVTTTAPTVAVASPKKVHSYPLGAWMGFPILAFASFGLRSRRRRLAAVLLCTALASSVALESACGGSGSTTKPPPSGGTPSGTYTVTITATSGSLQHKPTVTVTVQ